MIEEAFKGFLIGVFLVVAVSGTTIAIGIIYLWIKGDLKTSLPVHHSDSLNQDLKDLFEPKEEG